MNDIDHNEIGSVSEEAALEGLLRRRHSCRAFLPKPVPDAVIGRIIEIAQRTASWCNAQPWQVEITRGEGTEAFRKLMSAHVEDQPVTDFEWPNAYRGIHSDRRRACGFALYESVGVARGDKEGYRRQMAENYRFFGAPHVAVISSDDGLAAYGAIDCGGFVANFLNAATALGVATIPQAALTVRSDLVRAHFGLPPDRRVVCAISFGYADPDHPANGFRTDRAPASEVVRFQDGA
jgi:nitroreductase